MPVDDRQRRRSYEECCRGLGGVGGLGEVVSSTVFVFRCVGLIVNPPTNGVRGLVPRTQDAGLRTVLAQLTTRPSTLLAIFSLRQRPDIAGPTMAFVKLR
jgi:hypothetical protein